MALFFFFLFFLFWPQPGYAGSPVVSSLEFSGNQAVGTRELRQLVGTRTMPWYQFLPWTGKRRYDPFLFSADLQRIRSHYEHLGYLSAVVDTSMVWSADRVRLTVRIQEGPLTRVREIELSGLPEEPAKMAEAVAQKISQLQGKPFARNEVSGRVEYVIRTLRNNGFAFAGLALETHFEEHYVDLSLRVDPGPFCRVGEIRISGNDGVAGPTVLRGVTFRPGDSFREDDLRDSQRQLYRAGVFRSVTLSVPEGAEPASPVDVVVQVSERPFRSIKLGGGYDTDEHIRFSAEMAHRNFWGDARQVRAASAFSSRAREVVVGLRQPYFYSSRNWLSLSGFVQRTHQSGFAQDEVGSNLALERNIGQHATLAFQVSGGLVDFKLDESFTEFRTTLLVDSRDDIFDPRHGFLAQLSVRERGLLFRSTGEFLQLTAEGRWFMPLPLRSVLGTRAMVGSILELGTPGRVPPVERFFAGGLSSVRGWKLDDLGPKEFDPESNRFIPIGGLSRLMGSLELRTRLLSYLGTALFLDVGKVGRDSGDWMLTDLGWSAGWGLRFLTPIGPLRFDMAYRLSDDPTAASPVQYHLSLGQAF